MQGRVGLAAIDHPVVEAANLAGRHLGARRGFDAADGGAQVVRLGQLKTCHRHQADAEEGEVVLSRDAGQIHHAPQVLASDFGLDGIEQLEQFFAIGVGLRAVGRAGRDHGSGVARLVCLVVARLCLSR